MSVTLTKEQSDVIAANGKIIVSASAGSGKTFVMMERLVNLLQSGVPVADILAVTFTNKAAAQMREKLRTKLIERLNGVDQAQKRLIKAQLADLPSANISTIHSLCARLLRTYFYCLDFDGSFEILSDDDAVAVDLKRRALDSVLEKSYADNTPQFQLLLACLRRKRSDQNIRALILKSYNEVRNTVGYEELLINAQQQYTIDGFQKVCDDYHAEVVTRANLLLNSVQTFQQDFHVTNQKAYEARFQEMYAALNEVIQNPDIFASHPSFCGTKPRDKEEDKEEGERYKNFVTDAKKKYNSLFEGLSDRQTEQTYFLNSGALVQAYTQLLLAFNQEYSALKREEGKLDYTDLEHYVLKLLQNESILKEVRSRYRYVYVDEYQDVNPVQEEILSLLGGDHIFLVGDVKQAIYGFRGSKSLFFAQKFNRWQDGDGVALKLSSNFRSSDGVINFVNDLFSYAMTDASCGINYAQTSRMVCGAPYPQNCGGTYFYTFGQEEEKVEVEGVYSVKAHSNELPEPSREGLAIVQVVKECLQKTYYNLKTQSYQPITAGDICILTRKRSHESVVGIVRALQQAGIPVSGAGNDDILQTPEVKTVLDILSYIDNAEQDIPMVSTMLSPLGDFCENELAAIRVACQSKRDAQNRPLSFRACCTEYAQTVNNALSKKLTTFYQKMESFRAYADVFGAATVIERLLIETCWEVRFARGDGKKLQNIRTLAGYARTPNGELFLPAFLAKINDLDKIPAPDTASSESVKILTMHASKGLEFPIVILADICRTFRGQDYDEMPFCEEYGFTPKYYDTVAFLKHETLVRRLAKMRADKEELKNELNLYYVACTRAMYELHIFAEEVKPYSAFGALSATSFADFTNIARYNPHILDPVQEDAQDENADAILISEPDQTLLVEINSRFQQQYPHAGSVDLPVKSSASALLRKQDEDALQTAQPLFLEEDEQPFALESQQPFAAGTDVGTAYHRFLELCDLTVSNEQAIAAQKDEMLKQALISEEQYKILSNQKLASILSMSVFKEVSGAQIFREREFLCRIPANEFLQTEEEDGVIVQGAIDLLVIGKNGCRIVDYKYSKRSNQALVATYQKQLELYQKAVAIILKIDPKTIQKTIVNIRLGTEINL